MAETDESLKPDTFTYNTNLKALANSREKGSVQRARQILENMEDMYEDGDKSVKPDAITYNTVILAYANNGGKGAGRVAKSILKRMENGFRDGDVDVKPTSPTYTALIKGKSVFIPKYLGQFCCLLPNAVSDKRLYHVVIQHSIGRREAPVTLKCSSHH